MFKTTFIAAALAAATAFATVVPAQAAGIGRVSPSGIAETRGIQVEPVHRVHRHGRHWHHPNRRWHMSPRQVRRMLRHRGFYHIRFMDRSPPVYRVRAYNRRGRPVVLVIRSRTGEIVRRWRAHY